MLNIQEFCEPFETECWEYLYNEVNEHYKSGLPSPPRVPRTPGPADSPAHHCLPWRKPHPDQERKSQTQKHIISLPYIFIF